MGSIMEIDTKERLLELEVKAFEMEQKRATALSKSAFFPASMKNDVASAVIIYDLAQRMDISVMEVAQNIYIIHNRPSFSTSFLVARLNQSGKIKGALKTIVSEDNQSAYSTAIDAETGETLVGMTVTMAMAKAEGWLTKAGSKWATMPELMLRKRCQSFFIKEFYPEVLFGLSTKEEEEDIEEVESTTMEKGKALNSVFSKKTKKEPIDTYIVNNADEKPKDTSVIDNTDKELANISPVNLEQDTKVVESADKPQIPEPVITFLNKCGINTEAIVDFLMWADVVVSGEKELIAYIKDNKEKIKELAIEYQALQEAF